MWLRNDVMTWLLQALMSLVLSGQAIWKSVLLSWSVRLCLVLVVVVVFVVVVGRRPFDHVICSLPRAIIVRRRLWITAWLFLYDWSIMHFWRCGPGPVSVVF